MKFNQHRRHASPNLRLLLGLLISLLIHLAFLTRMWLVLPSNKSQGPTLQISLVNTRAHTSEATNPKPVTRLVENQPTLRNMAQPEAKASALNKIEAPLKQISSPQPPTEAQPVQTNKISSQPTISNQSEPQQSSQPSDRISPASSVEMAFNIVSGNDGKVLGYGLQRYESSDADHYQLIIKRSDNHDGQSASEDWQLELKGRIYRNILSPSIYQMQGDMARRLFVLGQDSEKTESNSTIFKGSMPDGILDKQSLLYQFMLTPPESSGGIVMLSDSKKYVVFTYHIEDIVWLDVESIGKVKTMHLKLTTENSLETIELWLATDYKYIAVKVRSTDLQGKIIEQSASSISIKTEH